MSIIGNKNMGTPFFHEFKKQASFYFKEKIKTARLALTDVTPAELLTEEAINGNTWTPDTRTMSLISRAAFEVDDYWRIVEILHKRLLRFERKSWRVSYKVLILLEHLLTHGPESLAEEFQSDGDVIRNMQNFQYIDERGFNWGLTVRKKSERVLKLLGKGPLLKEERDRARKLSRGIEGFGSFYNRSSTANGSLHESSFETFGRCNSYYNSHEEQKDQLSPSEKCSKEELNTIGHDKMPENVNALGSSKKIPSLEKSDTRASIKENIIPAKEFFPGKHDEWDGMVESNPLLGAKKEGLKNQYLILEDHPFTDDEHQSTASLLSTKDEILQGC